MYARQLFTAVIAALFLSSTVIAATNASPVRQSVDRAFVQLASQMQKEKKQSAKFKLLSAFEAKAKKLRAEAMRQPESDEIYLDQLLDSLQEIPRKALTPGKKCEETKTAILFAFEPTANGSPKQPAVGKTLQILGLLCK